MAVGQLLRLKGVVEAIADSSIDSGSFDAYVESYQRIRTEVANAVGTDYADELDRLFPLDIDIGDARTSLARKAIDPDMQVRHRAVEAQRRLQGIAGWLEGMIETALVDRRIQAEAEAKAKRVGFG